MSTELLLGGRVKMAGSSFRFLEDMSREYIDESNDANAQTVYQRFRNARRTPDIRMQRAFFPKSPTDIRRISEASPALLRSSLKHDQGPAGNFGGFVVDDTKLNLGQIQTTRGLAVPERHKSLTEKDVYEEVVSLFEMYDYAREDDARLEYNAKLPVEEGERREMGFLPHFFVRPVSFVGDSDGQYHFPGDKHAEISVAINQVVQRSTILSMRAKEEYIRGASFTESIEAARCDRSDVSIGENVANLPKQYLYLQPDVLVNRDGRFYINGINAPDLGFFLTMLHRPDHEIFSRIQQVMQTLSERVYTHISQNTVGRCLPILTRPAAVLGNDTLEQMEIEALTRGLARHGKSTQVTASDRYVSMNPANDVLILNLRDAQLSPDFLESVARGDVRAFPDPFFAALIGQEHTFRSQTLTPDQLSALKKRTTLKSDKPHDIHRAMQAAHERLGEYGFGADVFHLYNRSGTKHAPIYRHDIRSFPLAINAVGKDNYTEIREIPISSDNCLINDDEGGRFAVLRFMAIS